APKEQPEWETRFNAKMDRKIELYRHCGLRFEGDEAMIAYMERHRALLRGRPQCLQHGDYHTGNMLIDPAGELVIIDFDRMDYGDPWEEFNRIVWCAQLSPAFASGMIDGYFKADVPQAFWQLMALYICSNTLSSVAWAPAFGEREIQTMLNQAGDVVRWYDAMRSVVPTWYARPIGAHEMDREADA
ncbi:MAG: phosphotransferase, partial [Clostridia bacterium]|nr:phosphotransferase [Clostridia bacterium]